MFKAPINRVVLTVDTKYVRNFTSILKMAAIQNNSSVDPSDYVNIMGKVISVPTAIADKREYAGFSADDILPGDTAIFSHEVIYSFSQTDPEAEPIYKNSVWYKGKEFFVADITQIFAVIRDDKVRMLNGYVMVVEMQTPPKIILTAATKRNITAYEATVSQVQRDKGYIQGDVIYYHPNKLMLYQINGKPFGILRERDILGVKKSALI